MTRQIDSVLRFALNVDYFRITGVYSSDNVYGFRIEKSCRHRSHFHEQLQFDIESILAVEKLILVICRPRHCVKLNRTWKFWFSVFTIWMQKFGYSKILLRSFYIHQWHIHRHGRIHAYGFESLVRRATGNSTWNLITTELMWIILWCAKIWTETIYTPAMEWWLHVYTL